MNEIPDSDLKVERFSGVGAGGQHSNRHPNCIRLTHIPSGLVATVRGRHFHRNLAKAKRDIARMIQEAKQAQRAAAKKDRRDRAIHETPIIRTYDYKSGNVRDHRTGKAASIKDVLVKGKVELMWD